MKRECKYCLVEQDITMFQKRSRRTSRIWKCNSCRAAESRSKAETAKAKNRQRAKRQRFLDEHGIEQRAVETFAKKVGLPATDPDTIETYKLHVSRQKLLSTLRKVVRDIRRQSHKKKLSAQRQLRMQNKGRLTPSQAWMDWSTRCRLQWFIDAQVKAPRHRFENNHAKHYKWNYKHIASFRLSERNRRRVRKLTKGELFNQIDAAAYTAVRKRSKSDTLTDLLGYTPEELRQHIESSFHSGMCWEKIDQIHIDHIIPCSYFDMTSTDEVKACWSLVNLKPEWAAYNQSKSNKIVESEVSRDLLIHIKENASRLYSEQLQVLAGLRQD